MPIVSQAQRRWAWANKDKGGKEGAAAKEFAASDTGGKLPERKSTKKHHSAAERRKAMYRE